MTSFGPAAFASWDEDPAGSNVLTDTNGHNGTIGIVDPSPGKPLAGQPFSNPTPDTDDDNQGARMVWAGQKGQEIADVRLVLPNRFVSGDILDLRLLDRSAIETDDGLSNKDASTLVGFSGTEGVTVEVSEAMDPRTTVAADTDAIDYADGRLASPRTSGNTETETLAWAADSNQPASSPRNTRPSAKPAFAMSVNQSNRVQGNDNLRLRVDNRSTGDPNAVWVVTIKGLKVDLGEKVTPGDLRLVPFLSNTKPGGDSYTTSPWFYGNHKEDNAGTTADTSDDTPREIGIYTVPAFVSPVRISSTQNEIVADGVGQRIGDLTISETQGFSLQDGTYSLRIDGAKFANGNADSIKATVTDGGTNETVQVVSYTPGSNVLQLRLSGTDAAKSAKISLSGLLLSSDRSGQLRFTLSGQSIDGKDAAGNQTSLDGWIVTPAGSSTRAVSARDTGSKQIWPAAALLGFDPAAQQVVTGEKTQWSVPLTYSAQTPISGSATPVSLVNSTAGGPALPAGTYTVGANGATITGPVNLTRDVSDDTAPYTYKDSNNNVYQLSTSPAGVPTANTKFTVEDVAASTVEGNPASVLAPGASQTTTVTVASKTQELKTGLVLTYDHANTEFTSTNGGKLGVVTSTGSTTTLRVTVAHADLGTDVKVGDVYVLDAAVAAGDDGETITLGADGNITAETLASTPTALALDVAQSNVTMPNGSYTLSANGLTLTGASGAATGMVLDRTAVADDASTTGVNEATQWTVNTAPTASVDGIDVGDLYTISPALRNPGANTADGLVITGGVVNTDASEGLARDASDVTVTGLPDGTYAVVDSQANLTQASKGLVASRMSDDSATPDVDETGWYRVTQAGTSGLAVGHIIRFSAPLEDDGTVTVDSDAQTVTGDANGQTPQGGPFSITLATDADAQRPANTPALPQADYTIAADGSTIVGGGLTLTRQGNGTYKVTSIAAGQNVYLNDVYTVAGLAGHNGKTFTVDETGVASAWVNVPFTAVVSSGTPLPAGTYTVTANGAGFDITNDDGVDLEQVRNGVRFTANQSDNGIAGSYVFTGLVAGMEFEITGGGQIEITDRGVNQTDISAEPALSELVQLGRAVSESARIGGNNRYETAAKIAERWASGDKSNVHGKVRNAIIASGENFPDALSASYLSQRMGAPILLTQRGSLPADTIEALRDRQVDKVFIIGGPAAVSNDVRDQLANLNTYRWVSGTPDATADGVDTGSLTTTGAKLQVQRLSSANPQNDTRYTTNQLVNMYAAAWGGVRTIGKTVYKSGEAGKYTAIFARGDNFPDALAAGVLSAGIKGSTLARVNYSNDAALPLILTQPSELSGSAKAQIENFDVQHGLVIGSEDAISDGVKGSLESAGLSTTRIGGADRYFTAAAVAEFAMRPAAPSSVNEYPGLGFLGNPTNTTTPMVFGQDVDVYLANGLRFPDALTAAPWLGQTQRVLNLTMDAGALSDGTKDFLSKRAADVDRVNALGLGAAVSSAVLTEANQIASSK